jgi:hypothetical protein
MCCAISTGSLDKCKEAVIWAKRFLKDPVNIEINPAYPNYPNYPTYPTYAAYLYSSRGLNDAVVYVHISEILKEKDLFPRCLACIYLPVVLVNSPLYAANSFIFSILQFKL